MKINIVAFLLFAFMIIVNNAMALPDPPKDGKSIFTSRCASCHNVNKDLTGPALAGVETRRSMEWIISFVKSSQTMVKNGDKDALAIFEKFNRVPMPDHPDLTEENIQSIVSYIKESAQPVETNDAPFAKPSKKKPAYRPVSIQADSWLLAGLIFSIILLILTLLFAVNVSKYKKLTELKKSEERTNP